LLTFISFSFNLISINYFVEIYNIKEFVQPKMCLSSSEFLIWKERWRGVGWVGREKAGGWAGHQAGIFKVRLGLGEIEWRDRYTER
jgi:hypothetical protein